MSIAVEHLKRHWLVIVITIFLLGIVFNFNTIVFLLTSNPKVILNVRADALASRMFFSPASGNYNTGDLIAVSVLLDSTKDAVNAVGGEIIFPTDKLQIKSISTKNSINTFWVPTNPYFSTTTNTIIFSGGLSTPGFLGLAGNILTVVFQAKTSGPINLKLINTSVLANDGLGTNLAVPNQPASFSITTPLAISYPREDLNQDGKVNFTDLSILVSNWGTPTAKGTDINGDGVVDVKDLSILLSKLTPLVSQ